MGLESDEIKMDEPLDKEERKFVVRSQTAQV